MVKPRFRINVYSIGGIVFVVVGIGLLVGSQMVPLAASVLLPMGVLFTLIGVVWAGLAGRRGSLKPPRGLAENGTRATARLVGVKATLSTTRAGEYGPTISQVYRLDLEVAAPNGPYTVRVFRSLRGQQVVRAVEGATVPVAIDPSNRRKIAILWGEVQPFGGAAGASGDLLGNQVIQAFQAAGFSAGGLGAGFAGGAAPAVPPPTDTTVSGRLAGVTPVGTSASGQAALQVVVEVSGPQGSRFAQGVVQGPSGRTPQVGDQVTARLDQSGASVVSIRW